MKWLGYLRVCAATLAIALCAACAADLGPARARANSEAPAMSAAEYRLGPGDRIRVSVFGEAELSGEFVVGPSGAISYPLVGEVPAEGKTAAELTASLGEVLRAGYVRQPLINIEVLTYRPFYILGEVGAPGTYPYTAGLTVMNAVATAGGFTYRADTRRVFIKHRDAEAEELYRLTSTTQVQPGDTVRIPERRF